MWEIESGGKLACNHLCNNYQEGGGRAKTRGGALHKIAAKIGGVK